MLAVLSLDINHNHSERKALSVLSLPGDYFTFDQIASASFIKEDYEEYKENEIERIIRLLEEILPEIKIKKVLESASPNTYERQTGTIKGSLYGLKQKISQQRLNSRTSIKGLFLAGQSINMPGIMAVMLTSFLICSRILGFSQLYRDLKKCR